MKYLKNIFLLIIIIVSIFIGSQKFSEKELKANEMNLPKELLLVNKEYGLEKDYIPNLKVSNIIFTEEAEDEEKQVDSIVIEPLENLINDAKEEGIILIGNSGYRSYASQKDIYRKSYMSNGNELTAAYVAKPGFSEHQTGLCIDITNEERYFVEWTKEAKWLAENCYKYGFIIRYPKGHESITGIEYEPWHIRYVGKEAAKIICENEITLEEYLRKEV